MLAIIRKYRLYHEPNCLFLEGLQYRKLFQALLSSWMMCENEWSYLKERKIKNERWYWYFFNKPAGLNFSQVLLSIIYIIIYIQQPVIKKPRKMSHAMYGELIWADNLECGNLPLQLICHQWSWVTFLVEPDRRPQCNAALPAVSLP